MVREVPDQASGRERRENDHLEPLRREQLGRLWCCSTPNGEYQGSISGEGHYDALDRVIGRLVEAHKAKGELQLDPLSSSPEMERPSTGPLLLSWQGPGRPTGKRLFIADTGHNRIIQTGLEEARRS